MEKQFERNIGLIGISGQEKLNNSRILLIGVGGVGSYTLEALVRAGVGTVDIIDKDIIDETNINRQLIATHETIGQIKVDVAKKRMLSINPNLSIQAIHSEYYHNMVDFINYDYIIDCIDDVKSKIDIIVTAKEKGVPIISSMGTGKKLDPSLFRICDISKTSVCPLARVIRKELKDRNVKDVKVLYSIEEPVKSETISSISFVPSVAGLLIAGEVIKDLI